MVFVSMNQFLKYMDLTQLIDCLAIEPVTVGTWTKQIQDKGLDEPYQRQHHSAIIHKSSLFLYGGVPIVQSEDSNEQRTVYRCNLTNKVWTKTLTNFLNNNSFSYIYAHSTIIYNNMMYLFGGKNYQNDTYVIGLWYLNLQSYNWKRQELKGYSPPHRQNAAMVLHQRSSIILYGGRSAGDNLNDMHIYKIDNKMWVQIDESSYDMKICCRLKPAFISQGQHLYLFGGERMISNEDGVENVLLNDFYQLKFLNRPMSSKPDLWIKEIITSFRPSERASTFVNLNDKYLMLWGGDNLIKNIRVNQTGFWLYNINEIHWNWIKLKGNVELIPHKGYSITYGYDKCYIFGQYSKVPNSQFPKTNSSGLLVFNVDVKQIDYKLAQAKNKPKIMQNGFINCNDCNQYRKGFKKLKQNQFSILKQIINEKLEFVYAAFGLLVDNALILKAKQCRIVFHNSNKEKYCLIQDNGNTQTLWSHHNDFINDLTIFRTYVEENIDQLEEMKDQDISKKNFMKQEINNPLIAPNILNPKETKEQKELKEKEQKQKEEEKELRERKREAKRVNRKKIEDRKQFSRNIKLGSLRIGDRVIFINKYGISNENRRVFVIEKTETNNLNEYVYRTYYYILENNNLIESNMENAKKYIDEEYKMYFKIANDHREEGNNFLFITNLKEIANQAGLIESELKESSKHNDVFCCEKRQIDSLEDGILLQSIDISLKNYLSLLYIKNDQMKIFLTISDHKLMEISNLEIFEGIDNLVKSEKIIDLEEAMDLPNCNIIEAYYNKSNTYRSRDLSRKTASFNFLNGVLFYHKHRLISRYKFNLGEVNKLFKNKLKILQQALVMFGFIEIKDEFAVNIFKTGFIRDDLLLQIYHRLKFVEKYAEKINREQRSSRSRPFDDKNQKEKGDKGDKEPRKKFKNNEQGKNQIPNSQIIHID